MKRGGELILVSWIGRVCEGINSKGLPVWEAGFGADDRVVNRCTRWERSGMTAFLLVSQFLLSPKSGGFQGPWWCQIWSHSIIQKDFPCGKSFCMELMTRFELVTSSLPRMRSTFWATPASLMCFYPKQLIHHNTSSWKFQYLFERNFLKCEKSCDLAVENSLNQKVICVFSVLPTRYRWINPVHQPNTKPTKISDDNIRICVSRNPRESQRILWRLAKNLRLCYNISWYVVIATGRSVGDPHFW